MDASQRPDAHLSCQRRRVVAGLSVCESGAGPPLVLLHGWHADAETNWGRALGDLAGWRVIAPDLPGHGASPSPERFSIKGCANAVAAVCDELDVSRAVVVGYSMGGPVAQQLTRQRRDLVGGLVMVATAARLRPTRDDDGPGGLLAQGARLVIEAGATIASVVAHERELRRRVFGLLVRPHAAALLQAATELARWDARRWVPELGVPAASIVTSRDRAVPPEAQRELADLLRVPADRRFEAAQNHLFCLRPGFGELVARAAQSVSGVAAAVTG